MEEAFTNAIEEIKRVDHLIYVSLKYTRTVDVIRSIVNRLIDTYNAIIDGFLEKYEKEGKIYEIPTAPMLKVNQVKEMLHDEKLNEFLDFYLFLRQLYRADYNKMGEFRKNVSLLTTIDGKDVVVNIERITEYYTRTKEFMTHIKQVYIDKSSV